MVFVNKAIFKSIKIRKLPKKEGDIEQSLFYMSQHDNPHKQMPVFANVENLINALTDNQTRCIEYVMDDSLFVIELTQPI